MNVASVREDRINAQNRQYVLSKSCFAALLGSDLVLLDLNADEYMMIDASASAPIIALLSTRNEEGLGSVYDPNVADIFEELKASHAITSDISKGKPIAFVSHIETSIEVPGPRAWIRSGPGAYDMIGVLLSLVRAFYLLKIRGLRAATSYVRRLRRKCQEKEHDETSVARLVEAYNRTKPIFLGSKDNCLLNALSMIVFLSRSGVVPYWCFGVSTRPFSAHCWVEDEHWLYNDQYQRTHAYTPIMRV